jgi:hypothetical protein
MLSVYTAWLSTPTHVRAHTHTCTHKHTHAHTHMHTHTHAHTHMHTRNHSAHRVCTQDGPHRWRCVPTTRSGEGLPHGKGEILAAGSCFLFHLCYTRESHSASHDDTCPLDMQQRLCTCPACICLVDLPTPLIDDTDTHTQTHTFYRHHLPLHCTLHTVPCNPGRTKHLQPSCPYASLTSLTSG